METGPSEATEQGFDGAGDGWEGPSPDGSTEDPSATAAGSSRRATLGRPPSVNAIFAILVVAGGGLLGYAVAIAGNGASRDYSLIWALLGAALIVTAWGLGAGTGGPPRPPSRSPSSG